MIAVELDSLPVAAAGAKLPGRVGQYIIHNII